MPTPSFHCRIGLRLAPHSVAFGTVQQKSSSVLVHNVDESTYVSDLYVTTHQYVMAPSALKEIEVEELALAQSKALVKLRVFVGGPYLDLAAQHAPQADAMGGATLLRYSICRHIEDAGHTVTVGENAKLQAAYAGHLDALYEASTFEMMHVKDHCDGVIILPSSAGSFLELGYFSADDQVCSKMLILRNETYLPTPGYLHYGPSIQAKMSHAEIEDVNYTDIPSVLKIVDAFLGGITVKKIRSRVRIK